MPLEFTNAWGMRFLFVADGTFEMGSGDRGETGPDATPRHEVKIVQPYYVQASKTTVAEWTRVLGAAPAGRGPDDAAAQVPWADAEGLATHLTERDPRWIYRLPTEAEWVHAGGGGAAGRDEVPAEWCMDWYGPYPSWGVMSPIGAPTGTERVTRGGTTLDVRWHAPPDGDHLAGVRLVAQISYAKSDLGAAEATFRVIDPEDPDPATQEREGYELRVVAVPDRLAARQFGWELPWVALPGRGARTTRRLPPGRYYVIAVVPGSSTDLKGLRGPEIKFTATAPAVRIDVPIPPRGVVLQKPQ